jgi:hypothetical protein
VIIAPRFSDEALAIFRKKKNLRLMIAKGGLGADSLQEVRSVIGGVLVQDRDRTLGDVPRFQGRDEAPADGRGMGGMLFGWKVCKHVKSNAIVYCRGEQTLGIGAGQMARVDSSRIAVWKAGEAGLDLKGSVVASEALFPFADGLIAAADAGATAAAIQPGRLGARRGHQGRRRARDGDGLHRHPALQTLAKLRAGMLVVYRNRFGETIAHRLVARQDSGWQIKGYNNDQPDSTLVTGANLIGVVYATFYTSSPRVDAGQLAATTAPVGIALAAPAR